MSEIRYVRGDATAPSVKGVKVIAHVCNDVGGWGKGFVPAVSRRRPEPEAAYRARHRDRASHDFGLGAVQFVRVEPYVRVANMIGQRGTRTAARASPCATRPSARPSASSPTGRPSWARPCTCPASAAARPAGSGPAWSRS